VQKLKDSIKLEKNNNFDLMASFNESLKDPKFKTLIEKLKLPYEELSKYTTMLEDSSIEYNHCLNCKNILECKNKIKGYAYLPEVQNKKIKFGYKMCKKNEKITKKSKNLENVYCYNVPEQIRSAKMKDIFTDDKNRFPVIKWLNNFIKNYDPNKKQKGLYLYGSFGSGKTYLISAMFNELAKDGVKSAIVFWPEFLRDLKASFGTDFKEKYEFVKKVPLLLIDDIGAENTTAWGRDEIFCPLVQYRMEENLPTFFTSNLNIKELEEHFSVSKDSVDHVKAGRIISRITQLTDDIEMISANLRK